MKGWKKLVFCLLAAVLSLCVVPGVPACAAGAYVYDVAGLLSASERGALGSRAAEVSETYGCGVYIVTVEDYRAYGSGGVLAVAGAVYEENGFGLGADGSGVLLLLSMEDRDQALVFRGAAAAAFGEGDRDRLEEAYLDDFRRDDWYQGFADYISYSATILGRPEPPEGSGAYRSSGLRGRLGVFGSFMVIVVLPALIALLACTVAKRNMRSVKKAEKADFFVTPGSMKLYASEDRFTHVTQTRVKVESDSDRNHSGGGGGGGGRSGKF